MSDDEYLDSCRIQDELLARLIISDRRIEELEAENAELKDKVVKWTDMLGADVSASNDY